MTTTSAYFFLYSRTRRVDYRWLYGGISRDFEERLYHFTQALIPRGPSGDSPTVGLWIDGNWAVLLNSRLSDSRTDEVNRAILEYSYFVWETSKNDVRYGDLPALILRLQAETLKIVTALPKTYAAPSKQEQIVQLDLRNATSSDNSVEEEASRWTVSNELSMDDLLARRAVIRVPNKYPLGQVISPVRERTVGVAPIVSLVLSVQVSDLLSVQPPRGERLLSEDSAWYISDCRSNEPPAVLSKSPLPPQTARTEPSLPPESEETGMTGSSSSGAGSSSSRLETTEVAGELLAHATRRAEQFENESSSKRGTLLARVAAPFSRGESPGRGESRGSLKKTLVKLSLLLMPVASGVPVLLALSWSNLLREVEAFHDPSLHPSIREEWIRRLHALLRITTQGVRPGDVRPGESAHLSRWAYELDELCSQLGGLLQTPGRE